MGEASKQSQFLSLKDKDAQVRLEGGWDGKERERGEGTVEVSSVRQDIVTTRGDVPRWLLRMAHHCNTYCHFHCFGRKSKRLVSGPLLPHPQATHNWELQDSVLFLHMITYLLVSTIIIGPVSELKQVAAMEFGLEKAPVSAGTYLPHIITQHQLQNQVPPAKSYSYVTNRLNLKETFHM